MQISIRKFCKDDIENKVKWINDPQNNTYLHYDLPLEYEKTAIWFENIKNRNDRYDGVILVDGVAVGLIGLLQIDRKNSKAEIYIALGEQSAKGKGVAKKALQLMLEYAFATLGLNKIYLCTEVNNLVAQALFEKSGFKREGLLKEDLIYNNRKVDRYFYGLTAEEFTVQTNNNRAN
ncbi:MAG: GNAT family N-acetyltransferase [Clostridia bacterium]|nr:GNAT family N-acetyltransferase [Clostridia bacterium]